MSNTQIHIISHPQFLPEESQLITALFEQGMEIFHLRKPDASTQETENLINNIPEKFHPYIILHYHFCLADKYLLKGLHFNKYNCNKWDSFNNNSFLKGYSAHSINEIKALSFNPDYCFLSPVFDSISKKEYLATSTLQKIIAKEQLKTNIIALGGILPQNIPQITQWKYDGVAFLGYLWNNLNHNSSTKKQIHTIIYRFQSIKKSIL